MSNAGELITVYRLGHRFQASRRTVAHLDWTIKRLKRRYPWATLVILQTCYHTGVAASAGTHDFDCVFDFKIVGIPWRLGQRFLRAAGWFGWFRHTGIWANKDAWHLHFGSIPPGLRRGCTAEEVGKAYHSVGAKVGEFIDGGWTTKGKIVGSSQVVDYFSTPPRDGLIDHGIDSGSFYPKNINATIFQYTGLKQ